jgi:hypothetical protein
MIHRLMHSLNVFVLKENTYENHKNRKIVNLPNVGLGDGSNLYGVDRL